MALFALKHSVFPNPNDVMISQKRVWSGLSKDLDALIDATFGYIPPASSLYYCQWNTIQCLKFYYHLVDSSDIQWTDYTRFAVIITHQSANYFFPCQVGQKICHTGGHFRPWSFRTDNFWHYRVKNRYSS